MIFYSDDGPRQCHCRAEALSSFTATSIRISLTARFRSATATSTSRNSVPRPTLSRIAFAATPSGTPLASKIGDTLQGKYAITVNFITIMSFLFCQVYRNYLLTPYFLNTTEIFMLHLQNSKPQSATSSKNTKCIHTNLIINT